MAEARIIERGDLQLAAGGAFAIHVVLFALLSTVMIAPEPLALKNPPMEVDLIAEVAPVSTAPEISDAPPPPRLGEEDAVDEVLPIPTPTPPERMTPVPAKTPAVKTPPPKAQPKTPLKPPTKEGARPTGRLDGIADGLAKDPVKAPSPKGASAAKSAAQVQASFSASIGREVAAKWNSNCVSGVDVNKLGANLRLKLSPSGSLQGYFPIEIIGANDNNRFQLGRFEECLKKAVQLAAPFDVPAEEYDYWKTPMLRFQQN